MTPAPLTDRDKQTAFSRVIPEWELDRLDTRQGTAATAKALRSRHSTCGGVGPADDGVYSDGASREWWSLSFDAGTKGVEVKVTHNVRDGDSTVLRQGRLSWNEIANRATIAALERRRQQNRELKPQVGDQLVMTL